MRPSISSQRAVASAVRRHSLRARVCRASAVWRWCHCKGGPTSSSAACERLSKLLTYLPLPRLRAAKSREFLPCSVRPDGCSSALVQTSCTPARGLLSRVHARGAVFRRTSCTLSVMCTCTCPCVARVLHSRTLLHVAIICPLRRVHCLRTAQLTPNRRDGTSLTRSTSVFASSSRTRSSSTTSAV